MSELYCRYKLAVPLDSTLSIERYGKSKFDKKEINNKKVNILAMHLNYGGIENVLCNQANMLADDYDVEIICLYNSHNKIPFELSKKVRITYLLDTISNREELNRAIKKFDFINTLKGELIDDE